MRLIRLVYYWYYQNWFDGDWLYYVSVATPEERRRCREVIGYRRASYGL